jgi:SAM-dependent methyltransferase
MASGPSAPAVSHSWRRKLWHALIRSRVPFKGPLMRAYLRALERRRSREDQTVTVDEEVGGVPIPPARLRVLVAGIPDRDWFLHSGRAQTNHLRELLSEVGRPVGEMGAILDWGCGCGRMARWWAGLPGPEIHGCDYNGELVNWCERNLPFMQTKVNGLEPPLPYADGRFDLVYAFSVFTHLSIELAREWLAELERIVMPGGLAWFTLHGASYRTRLSAQQQQRFDAGEIVVWFPEIEGTNLCAAYWPEAAVAGMLGDGFEILAHLDPLVDPARAQTAQLAPHDSYLVRRR